MDNEEKPFLIVEQNPEFIGTPCDEKALGIVDLMPKWTPWAKDGILVNTTFTFPIKFQLQRN